MIDRYIWGSVSRISPEAPVPVIDMDNEQARLGGAANVAMNIKSLGGEPLLMGVTGEDNSGRQMCEIMRESGFPLDGIVSDPSRPTTVKTRVIAHSQHVVRIDRETKADIAPGVVSKLLAALQANLSSIDGIIIEDYNKGVIVEELITKIIAMATKAGKLVTVDPKFNNFFNYKNVTLFKPNRKEAEEALGTRLKTRDDILKAGTTLMNRLSARNVLLTLGEEGVILFKDDGSILQLPTKARKVADVSGAGDTVISTLTMTLTGGASLEEAAVLANFAGGIVCGYVGIVPINTGELVQQVLQDADHRPMKAN
jgi:D-glycero-beta-D-manno-heptose-7-phosphate kinase